MIRLVRVCACGHLRGSHDHDTRPGDTPCAAPISLLADRWCPCPQWRPRWRWTRRPPLF